MLVSKWGNSLAVRLLRAVIDTLGLKSGDRSCPEPWCKSLAAVAVSGG